MNKQRLLILAKHLDKHVESSEFSLDSWKKETPECGTVACACGHAASIPAFRELGLYLEQYVRFPDNEKGYSFRFGDFCGWYAVMMFFELSWGDAINLFSGESYTGSPTPQDVAARIEAYVKTSETQ